MHSGLVQAVSSVFDEGSLLGQATEAFAQRSGQREMARAVAQTIEAGGALVVEAGTGVGKTFAYLVPALLSGERVMVSTATKALQDQLFARDLPRLLNALGLPARTALLKGRSSYLCIHRMKLARQEHVERSALLALAKIEKWAVTTPSGDLAELPGLDERSSVIPLVTSTRDNCLGSTCPQYKNCHVVLARKQALAADVVVVNHHCFLRIWQCANRAWRNCCPRCELRFLMRRISSMKPVCSSWARCWARRSCLILCATCWLRG